MQYVYCVAKCTALSVCLNRGCELASQIHGLLLYNTYIATAVVPVTSLPQQRCCFLCNAAKHTFACYCFLPLINFL